MEGIHMAGSVQTIGPVWQADPYQKRSASDLQLADAPGIAPGDDSVLCAGKTERIFHGISVFSFCKRKNMDILRVSLLAFSGFGWYTKDAALRCLFQIWRLHGNLKSNCKGPCNKAKILKESWYGI